MAHTARALLYRRRAGRRRGGLPIVSALASQRLVGWRRRWTAAPVTVVHIIFHMLIDLLEEEGSLQPHLLDTTVETRDTKASAVVVLLDVIDAPAQVDAFAVIGCFNRWWKVLLREGSRGC